MGRFSHSWGLTKTSMTVLRQDKELLWMPVLSGVATLLSMLLVLGVGVAVGVLPEVTTVQGTVQPAAILLSLALYILLAFVTLFFNAAVVAAATQRLNGQDPTVGSALRAAANKAGKLLVWAVVVGIVNLILQTLREMASRQRNGAFLSQLLISFGAGAWNLATAFMVPVLLFEDKGLGDSFRSSVSTTKRVWGETVIGIMGLGAASSLAVILTLVVGGVLAYGSLQFGIWAFAAAIALTVVAILIVASIFSVLGGIYRAALYRFATTGQAAGGFTAEQLSGSVMTGRRSPW